MILFYEVYEIGTGWDGKYFKDLEECQKYIRAQCELSPIVYTSPKTEESFKIIPHSYLSPKVLILDEYAGIDNKNLQENLKKVLTYL